MTGQTVSHYRILDRLGEGVERCTDVRAVSAVPQRMPTWRLPMGQGENAHSV